MDPFAEGFGGIEPIILPLKQDEPIQYSVESTVSTASEESGTRIQRAYGIAKRALQSAVVMAELLPTNEAIRYGAFAYTETQTNNPFIGAAVLGLTTLVVEGSAAVASAELIASNSSRKAIGATNWLVRRFVSDGARVPILAEAGLAMTGGSVVSMAAKQIENPSRTPKQNRRRGIVTSSLMSGYFTVEGGLLAAGIQHPSPETIGALALVAGGVHFLSRIVKKRFVSRQIRRGGDGNDGILYLNDIPVEKDRNE